MSAGQPAYGRFPPGSSAAGYQIEATVGQGGMATVYRALDPRLRRTVALKILAPALAGDEEFRARFIRESRAAAGTDHPHIIPVYAAGESDGVLFMAMRFVRGGDLRWHLSQAGSLPPSKVAEIVSQTASALDAAHNHGLVHRDVKPGNLLLDVGGETGAPDHVYVTDFGLSKDSISRDTLAALTVVGQVLGTLDYMAPEQIEGRSLDGRADQYGLACTAYELLCGTPPFGEQPGPALMRAHRTASPPRLTSRMPGLPRGIDAIFERALAKARSDRYGSCLEFAGALRAACGLAPYRSGPEVIPARYRSTPRVVPPSASPAQPAVPRGGSAYPATAPTIRRAVPPRAAPAPAPAPDERTEVDNIAAPRPVTAPPSPARRRRWWTLRRGRRSIGGAG